MEPAGRPVTQKTNADMQTSRHALTICEDVASCCILQNPGFAAHLVSRHLPVQEILVAFTWTQPCIMLLHSFQSLAFKQCHADVKLPLTEVINLLVVASLPTE